MNITELRAELAGMTPEQQGKYCAGCKTTLPISSFWISKATNKPRSRCKLCEIKRRKNLPDEVKRGYMHRWRDTHPDTIRAAYKRHGKNRAHTYRHETSRASARRMVRTAIGNGTLVKPDACSLCGSTENIQSHHDDYTKPLLVRWVCSVCHGKIHRKKSAQRSEAYWLAMKEGT